MSNFFKKFFVRWTLLTLIICNPVNSMNYLSKGWKSLTQSMSDITSNSWNYFQRPLPYGAAITTSSALSLTASPALRAFLSDYTTPLSFASSSYALFRYYQYKKKLTWDWVKIAKSSYPATAQDFPENFLWGSGTSAYQVDGNYPNSTYEKWALDSKNNYKESAGIACDHWNRYKEDIALMKEMGLKAYRFSIEWSKIQPTSQQSFDDAAADHYIDVCRELLTQGITPIIGFHHYSDPQWFMNLGGFEKEKNRELFIIFCLRFFNKLSSNLPELFSHKDIKPLFLTFNSPASYAANGYLTGNRPPGKKGNMQAMANTIKNMLDSHVQIYKGIKNTSAGKNALVGITHNIYQLDPYYWINPIAHLKTTIGNDLTHGSIYRFFTHGEYGVSIPFKAHVTHRNNDARKSLDFIGLNYYGHGYMATAGGPLLPPDETQLTENYTLYAEGLARAVKELSINVAQPLGIPIYITEHGVGNNKLREKSSQQSMYALATVAKEHNVRGCMHWSFMDNFEWQHGYDTYNYGLVAIDRSTKNGQRLLTRTIKPESLYLINLMRQSQRLPL